jgi:predicted RND superfamily exporter protein
MEKLRVLVGCDESRYEEITHYLETKGVSAKRVKRNPLEIQLEIMRGKYDVALVSQKTKLSKSLCENLKSMENPPKLLLVRDGNEVCTFDELENFDGEIEDLSDCDSVYRKILFAAEISNSAEQIDEKERALYTEITRTIAELCITPKYKGYSYLREAIIIIFSDKSGCVALTKEIYPQIAKKFSTTAQSVERGIRTAIHSCWEKSEIVAKIKVFGSCALRKGWVPTNGEFVYIIADRLKCELKIA